MGILRRKTQPSVADATTSPASVEGTDARAPQAPASGDALHQAREAYARNDLDAARAHYLSLRDSADPQQHADGLVGLAQVEMKAGNWQDAWRLSLEATTDELAAPMSMVHLAVMSAQAGNFEVAREWATRAAATGDPTASAHAREMLPQIEEAMQQVSTQSAPTSDDDPALLEVADHCAATGQLEEARIIYQQVAGNPEPEYAAIALFNWANLEYAEQELSTALDLYDRAAALQHPATHLRALFNGANTARDLQRWEDARTRYLPVAESGDADLNARAMLCLAGLAHVAEDPAGEQQWLRRAVETGHPVISAQAAGLLTR